MVEKQKSYNARQLAKKQQETLDRRRGWYDDRKEAIKQKVKDIEPTQEEINISLKKREKLYKKKEE